MVLVYKLVVLGYLIYGCLLWGNNYGNPFRIMNDFPFRDHITPHYVHLDLLKFRDIVKITIVCFYMITSLIIKAV